jgi:putative DNA methylase
MPRAVLDQWEREMEHVPEIRRDAERQRRIAAYLDAGHGACWLRDGRIAEVVENTMLHFDGERYRLVAWVVMPNHIHALAEIRDGWPLAKVVYSWKTWTAKRANEILGRSGTFWFREYHDRFIRDETHLANARSYIEENPLKAGLCAAKADWRWGSAWHGR